MKTFDSDMVLQCLTQLILTANVDEFKQDADIAVFEYTLLILGAKNNGHSKAVEKRLIPVLEKLHKCPKTYIEALGVDYTE